MVDRSSLTRQISRLICPGGAWQNSTDSGLVLTSKLKIGALVKKEPLGTRRLALAGLRTPPRSAIAQRCVDGCLRIVESGAIATPGGQKDFAFLTEALGQSDKATAQTLKGYGRLQAGNIFKPKEKQILVAVAKLNNVDTGDAEAMRAAIDEFWLLLKSLGDPIADLALDLNDGQDFDVDIAAIILKAFLGDQYRETINPPGAGDMEEVTSRKTGTTLRFPNAAWRRKQRAWVERKFREIQRDVALRHWDFASTDETGIKGNLSADKIRDYHQQLFKKTYNLPPEAFGGSFVGIELARVFGEDVGNFVNGLLEWFWCRSCDRAVEKVT